MLIRILGYTLNEKKQVYIALLGIYGIGKTRSFNICSKLGIDPYSRANTLTKADLNNINNYVNENYKIGNDLKKEVLVFKKTLIDNGSYRGKRLKLGLPAHGQRSKSNAKTCRKRL